MLFNNLLDLIFVNEKCVDASCCDIINKYIIDNNISDSKMIDESNELYTFVEKIEIILGETIGKYYLSFANKCDGLNVVKEEMLFNQFCIYTNNYIDLFDVNYEQSVYKYMICILFLDDNSKITFLNNHILYPNKGDLILFPCEWFFIYNLEPVNKDIKNNIILNNIIKIY
jgi:hypothetical protein